MDYRTLLIPVLATILGGCNDCRTQLRRLRSRAKDDVTETPAPTTVASFTLEATAGGTPQINYNHTPLVETTYAFFFGAWKYASARVTPGTAPRHDTFDLNVPALGLQATGTVKRGPADLVYRWRFVAERDVDDVIGGGLEFRLRHNPTLTAQGAQKPKLLDDNRGFTWNVGNHDTLEVTFDGPIKRVFFERNRPDRIRVYFFGDKIKAGTTERTMRVALPKGGTVIAAPHERYAAIDPQTWSPTDVQWDRSPVDLRFLSADDRPAGQHGKVIVTDGQLAFADGNRARFWGANIAARTLFDGTKDAVVKQARRLASLGFNLVRLHHHDSGWYEPNIFADGKTTRTLRPQSLDMIDWWVKSLQEEGIYVWLDLHVGRRFRSGDNIADFEELAAKKYEGKAFNYINPDIERRMAEFADAYLNRPNHYTGRHYPEDPGIVAILVTNENDLTFHGSRFLSGPRTPPNHGSAYARQAEAFATGVGLSTKDALAPRTTAAGRITLAHLEASFSQRAIAQLRDLGYTGPVATTNYWGRPPLYCLPALTVGDIVDAHSYGNAEFLSVNPHYEPNFITWIGAGRAAGKPLTISEWNVPYPAPDRFAAPLYMASVASLQGWDAPVFFAYSQMPVRTPPKIVSWSALNDTGALAMMPAAALAYRRGDIQASATVSRIVLDRDTVYGGLRSANNSPALRTLVEQSRFEIELPDLPELDWDGSPAPAVSTAIVNGLSKSFLPAHATAVDSDTGELHRDWVRGIHTIATPRTQAIQGWIGQQTITLDHLEARIDTPKAAVALSSLDGAPIETSRTLLLTVIAQVESASPPDLPFLAEPIHGQVVLRSKAAQLTVTPLGPQTPASTRPRMTITATGDRHTLDLNGAYGGPWFSITAKD